MEKKDVIATRDKIAGILEQASQFRLDAQYTVQGETFGSYFLDCCKDQHIVIINRCSEVFTQNHLLPGAQFPLRFQYVDRGQTYTFEFPFVVQKTDSFKLFSAIYGKFPEALHSVTDVEPYQLILGEDQPLYLEFSLKDLSFREEVVMVSAEGVQFYPKSKNLSTGKNLWAGRKLEESRIIFPFGTVHVGMQLSKREGVAWNTRYVSPEPEALEKIEQFVTQQFFKLSYKYRFVKDDTLVGDGKPLRPWESRKILIFDKDEDTNLALREHLINMGYEVSGVFDGETALRLVRAQKPVLAIVDVPSPRSEGMKVVREIKENFYTKNTPVLILSSHFQKKDLPVIMHYGAKDLLEKPFDIALFQYKVNLILNPSRAGEPPSETAANGTAAPAAANLAADQPKLGTVVLANKNDEETACRVFDWARKRQLEVVMVEELNDFRRETIYKKPLVAIVNLQDVRPNVILEKCQEFKTLGLKRPLPVFIADGSLQPNTLQRAEPNMFKIHSVSDKFLVKLDSLISKLSTQ